MGQAPQQFEVASVSGVSEEPWGDNKDMTTTKVFFQGEDREWKVFHNVAWPVQIERGAVLEGWKNFDKGTFGLSNKHKGDAAPKPGSGSRSSSRSDGPGLQWKSAPYERGAEHPRNEARMIHTSALSAAPTFVEQMLTAGVAAQPKNEDAYWALVGHVLKKLVGSYQKALSATERPSEPPSQPQLNGGEVPADTREMAPASVAAGSDEDIPF